MKKEKAITLISLIITIVVLIILLSVAIYLSLGNNGIFIRTKQAKELTNKQTATEIINLKITNCQMNKYAEKQEMPTLQELADVLYEDNEIEYVALETKVGNKEKVTVGNKTSIFTKLNKYQYEFEINGQLQLASIDGIKVANNNNVVKKEVLWKSEEIGIQTVQLEKNISDYDFIIVYYDAVWNSGEAVLDTSETTYVKSFSYRDSAGIMYGYIMLDIEKNRIIMNTDYTEGEYIKSGYQYIKKVIGIKL